MAGGKKEYLVRGAQMFCDKGMAIKKLELPEDHGVYTREKLPMVHEKDCKVGEHIPEHSFGLCTGDCPAGDKVFKVSLYDEEGNVVGEEDQVGPACEPIITEGWKEPHETVFIDDGGVKRRALTTDSFLVCKYGGIISTLTSGQENG